jgi:DNA primase
VIPDSFKQDLLNRVDIVEVVSRYVQLKKGGANYLGLCPFHTEKTPSFSVSPAKQFYHCFGCGAHGNAIGFLMSYAGLGYIDAVKELASSAGMQVPEWRPSTPEQVARKEREPDLYAVMEKAMDFYRAELKKSPRAIEYLKGRGLSGEIAARFRIGYAPDDWQALLAAFPDYEDKTLTEVGLVVVNEEGKRYDRFRDRVMFPILNARGAVVGFGGRVLGEGETTTGESKGTPGPKYLNSPETPLFEKGREVYGLVQAREAIRAAGRVLVVEGYMDVVALAQFGVGCAVATLGTATTPVHVSKLLRLTDEVVFCFDGDSAGRKAAWRALEVSLPLATDSKPLRFLFLPEREDPDSYVRAHGQEAFERLAREAQTLSGFLLGELRAAADLGTPEGRARFVVSAKPHLQKIAAPGLKLQLVKEVAAFARLSQEEAERLLELRNAPAYTRPAPPRAAQPLPVSLEWKLLTRVFAKPELALEIDSALLKPELPESQALIELIERLQREEDPASITDRALVELIEQTQHARLLARAQAALSFELKLSVDDAAAEFHEFLQALGKREPEGDRLLRQKVLQGTASAEERLVFERKMSRSGAEKPLN